MTIDRDALIALMQSSQHAPMETHDTRSGECLQCPWPLHALGPEAIADEVLAALSAVPVEGEVEWEQVKRLVRDMTDAGECWFDHHGGCQEHGYLSLGPGEKCPHTEAKELIAAWEVAP